MIIDNSYVKNKMNEYIRMLYQYGFMTEQECRQAYNELLSLRLERIYGAAGDAVTGKGYLKYCVENIISNVNKHGEYYADEVFFHEFSHVINSLHKTQFGNDNEKFIIRDYISKRFNPFTSIELLEQSDTVLYDQDPFFGVMLLDEVVAQSIAQSLVIKKYDKMDSQSKLRYMKPGEIRQYQPRQITTRICEPPMRLNTILADYPEFYSFAVNFTNKYGYSINEFVNCSLKSNFFRIFIDSVYREKRISMEELYIDLCYLGIIRQRLYLVKGYISNDYPNDPYTNPRVVHNVMQKVLK